MVIDASVAVKWFLRSRPEEADTDLALQILERAASGQLQMIQPPHFVAEVAGVLARLSPATAQDDIFNLINVGYDTTESAKVYMTALDLAVRHQHHVFDTLYHALAINTPGAMLVTADAHYFRKARVEGSISLLSGFQVA